MNIDVTAITSAKSRGQGRGHMTNRNLLLGRSKPSERRACGYVILSNLLFWSLVRRHILLLKPCYGGDSRFHGLQLGLQDHHQDPPGLSLRLLGGALP